MLTVLYDVLSKLIDSKPVHALMSRQREIIEDIDPDRFYVENIRAFFNIPEAWARYICKLAVHEGAFEHKIGLLCPNEEHIVASFSTEDNIPDTVHCRICEAEGREGEHPTAEMERLDFYRLEDRADG